MTFKHVLEKYRSQSFSQRDKGDRFERLMQGYLLTDPKYAFRFKKVWLWNEFPGKLDLGGGDTGIDLVALTHEGHYWAIQCKFFDQNTVIDKPAVDSFLSTSSREFKNEQSVSTRFAQRMWISTSNKWGPNASESIRNQNPPVTRLNLFDLHEAPVDWDKLERGIHGEKSRTEKKSLRPHQIEALEKTNAHFKTADRGKLIMACGTGKTFTALRIAENETQGKGVILFLVPSIALLGQTLREWSADANEPINAICICSDPEISKKRSKNEDTDAFSVVDLALPASTNTENILQQFHQAKDKGRPGMTVVFSTYQSIDVISKAQVELLKNGFKEFDIVICDEAHRTTGVTLADEDESAFTKVHDNKYIKAKKRLYMTATPRLYNDDAKSKAAQADAVLCSMDDEVIYGQEVYRIGFGEAVERDLLTDYKVLILTLNDKDVPEAYRKVLTQEKVEITTDDASKLIGTINALSKQFLGDDGKTKETDPEPMRRAVAFCSSIAVSRTITQTYNVATSAYLNALPAEAKDQMVSMQSRHIDGTMTAPNRDELLGWLKAPIEGNECRVLTNVRCLSEGVDVPSLDAVLFLSARNSQVDVVQSVGRVMRKSPGTGKNYGYIIIPVVVPSDVDANKALDDNERYKVVWTVLNALRAHDDRFNATVNKIELNKKRPNKILVGRPEYSFDEQGNPSVVNDPEGAYNTNQQLGKQIALQFEQLQSVVFARMVQKVGDRRYWEQWAKDVAQIAERQIERIAYLVKEKQDQRKAFEKFLTGLQKNINPSITEDQAIEMLAQHIITRPIFDALFDNYSFVKHNAVSTSMQGVLDILEDGNIAEESESLKRFYDSVRKRAEGIDNAEGKQKIIIELYDKFFKTAFPKMAEQLGIVYTPVEVVDFIIHSVEDILRKEFNRGLTDENVHILDPFTGTGTFITRLLQSGLINKADLARKYHEEIHANEIVLLAYYIAAVNIENAYHDLRGKDSEYQPFDGIVLTDTFQLGESEEGQKLFSEMFPQNSARVERQRKAPIRIIFGNPPYSVGQKSANDNAQNQKYPKLEARVSQTYGNSSGANLQSSLYDAYIKAFRWSTDRLDAQHGGIIAFVSNGAWIDGNSADGFRKTLEKEFTSIWVFNLRGNQRTSGELSRKEGGKIFGSGSRTPISITILVKRPDAKTENAIIYYNDIGDYLPREEKLVILNKYRSAGNPDMKWTLLQPNDHADWLNQRNNIFETFISLAPEKNFNSSKNSFFTVNGPGVATGRDAWVYNYDTETLANNIETSIAFYQSQREAYFKERENSSVTEVDNIIAFNSQKINWTVNIKNDLQKGISHSFFPNEIRTSMYRPYLKQKIYFHKSMIERPGITDKVFCKNLKNIAICVSGVGANKDFSMLITDSIIDRQLLSNDQYFPLYYFDESKRSNPTIFDVAGESEYIRRDGVSDFILHRAQTQYGKNVTKEDIFYYIYGFLHCREYRTTFANDLKKMLPRIPLVEDVRDFWKFSKAGRQLADLHINYESVPANKDAKVSMPEEQLYMNAYEFYRVEKMRFPKKERKDCIIYNSRITIENIPAKAYDYVVNGKSAIEWIMERYQITVHKESGIRNDPNDWSKEVEKPSYIFDLLLSIINVSVQTVNIVNDLPKVKFE